MLTKEAKIKVLENFYALDYVFFGKPLTEVVNCCPLLKEDYLSIKGALLSVSMEMMNLIGYAPKAISEKILTPQLKKLALESAKTSRVAAQRTVQTEKARIDVKNEVKAALSEGKKIDVPQLVETKIREKAYRLAVDNLLVAKTLVESRNYKALNTWAGKIVEDSYKVLRDNLCESAMVIVETEIETKKKLIDEVALQEGPVGSIAGMILFTPVAWALWRMLSSALSKKRRQCGVFRISSERDKCMERYNIMKYEAMLKVAQKQLSECDKTKDPQKCKAKAEAAIQKLNKTLSEKQRKYEMRWGKS